MPEVNTHVEAMPQTLTLPFSPDEFVEMMPGLLLGMIQLHQTIILGALEEMEGPPNADQRRAVLIGSIEWAAGMLPPHLCERLRAHAVEIADQLQAPAIPWPTGLKA
jgi:hypothetical protein